MENVEKNSLKFSKHVPRRRRHFLGASPFTEFSPTNRR